MEIIVLETKAYEKLHDELIQRFQLAMEEAQKKALEAVSPENDWIDTQTAKQLLGVRSKTKMQELRDEGSVRFTQHGRIIKYSKKSILQFLNNYAR